MMFSDLYENCFKNISVTQCDDREAIDEAAFASNDSAMVGLGCSAAGGGDDNASAVSAMPSNGKMGMTTLDSVFSVSKFVLFYLINSDLSRHESNRNNELVEPIKALLLAKRSNRNDMKSNVSIASTTSSSSTPPSRLQRIFGVGKKKSKKMKNKNETPPVSSEISVVVFDINFEDDCQQQQQQSVMEPGWYIVVPMNSLVKSRLLRALCSSSTPSLVVVDGASRQVIATDCRRVLQEDPSGHNFPWWNSTADELFQGIVLRNIIEGDGSRKLSRIDYKSLAPIVKGIYFAANWCPPCRLFTKQLLTCYGNLKAAGIPFEIFFCSSDRSQESFEHHFSTMPWLAFDFIPKKLIQLTRLYNVNGIPAFHILDEQNRIITRHGRNAMLGDPHGKKFPWGPQPIYELNEYSLCRFRDEPSLVLFTEGSPEDIAFSIEVLKSISESLFAERNSFLVSSLTDAISRDESSNGDGPGPVVHTISTDSVESITTSSDVSVPCWADPLQVFYTGEDPICDLVLEGLGYGEAELPLIGILDVVGGRMAICTKPDVSADIVTEFVAEYRAGKVRMIPLPSSCQSSSTPVQVGGIPIRAIHQALGMGNSPSQNSMNNENMTMRVM